MKHIMTLSILVFSCVAKEQKQNSMLPLLKSKDSIEKFWNWFVNNKDKYENIDESDIDENKNIGLILEQLSNVEEGLAIEITKGLNGVRDIVISADGDRNKFEIVKEIVSKAPRIDNWTVTAFRQRVKEDFTLVYEDIEFTPSKMYFDPVIDGDSLDVIIFVRNILKHDYNQAAYYGLITIDNVLGEYDCVMKVRHYDFQELGEVSNKEELRPLTGLPKYVDEFHLNKSKKNKH